MEQSGARVEKCGEIHEARRLRMNAEPAARPSNTTAMRAPHGLPVEPLAAAGAASEITVGVIDDVGFEPSAPGDCGSGLRESSAPCLGFGVVAWARARESAASADVVGLAADDDPGAAEVAADGRGAVLGRLVGVAAGLEASTTTAHSERG
jgi:hypothetical protein